MSVPKTEKRPLHIFDLSKVEVSDGCHTMSELYEHRHELFLALCRYISDCTPVWRSRLHSDGTSLPGWFVLGIRKGPGQQITYHLPMSRWEESWFAETLERAPEFDGHTSEDVLEKLRRL